MVLDARPAVGRQFVHLATVTVFVFDRVFIDAGAHYRLLLGMDDHGSALVLIANHGHVAVGIDREPIKGRSHLKDEAIFAESGGDVVRPMRVFGVSVEAADTAFQNVAQLNVHPVVHAFHGDLPALATVLGWVNGHGVGHLPGRSLFPDTAGAHDFDAVKDERRHVAAALVDGGLDDAVVHNPVRAVISDGHRVVDRRFGDRGEAVCRTERWQRKDRGEEGRQNVTA